MNYSSRLPYLYRSVAIISVTFICFFTVPGCKKDHLPGAVTNHDSIIAIAFSNNTIPLALVDSVSIGLLKKGSVTPYFLRFQNAGTELQADIGGFNGEYTADIILHTRVAGSDHRREYYRKMIINIGNNNGKIFIDAPGVAARDEWTPRVILSYNNELDFYVSLDQSDPYFRVRVTDRNKWKKITIGRSANNKIPGTGTELLSTDAWTCTGNCFINLNLIENTQAFIEHADRLRNKTWNFGEIEILAETNDGIKMEDYHYYDR